jgi:hypothetical protein
MTKGGGLFPRKNLAEPSKLLRSGNWRNQEKKASIKRWRRQEIAAREKKE